jgi:hypothetical protein
MVDITQIKYRDIAQNERIERERLRARLAQLTKISSPATNRTLSPDEATELARITEVLKVIDHEKTELCERLFVGIRDLFNQSSGLLGHEIFNHDKYGILSIAVSDSSDDAKLSACCKAALTIGLLMIDRAADVAPVVHVTDVQPAATANTVKDDAAQEKAKAFSHPRKRIVSDNTGSDWAKLSRMFFAAIGETQSMLQLAKLVLPLLAIEGDPKGSDDKSPGTVDAAEFALVMRRLAANHISAYEPQLRRHINEALNVIQNRGADGATTQLGIDIPDFEDAAEASIAMQNVQAVGVFLCGAMFEEVKLFEVVEKLVEQFQAGTLTRTGDAGQMLYTYWKDTPNRMSDAERRNFYSMTMGIPGGSSNGMINREFNDLWLRFVSSVSSFVRKNEVDRLLRAPVPAAISQQQVRKAARDLAVNLSMHGYGMTYHAAKDLQLQLKFMFDLLSDKDIKSNYGANDMWQVVDQVATLELGGAKTSSRYRTLATCGAIITAWLATNVDRITRSTRPIIDMDEVRMPTPRTDGSKATTKPTDYDLVNACELWLADTGTGDTIIDQMAQPRETPVMTSRPVQIPAIAREMLADLPGMGLSYQNTRH